ncbi:uncharacterized protein LY79DRAFT_268150 [Colletotrichum navitas]|uniref:Uncharacterized protein n=1 Tax=Colletotrichum navitas TaxID=681940 RepID=A0AAD8PVU3_9PEZI|nr:uncharacterized protein LY79DRAFT_268150 [Colletotrichum navitas]KAK1585432.1 hypothetical protein LY79DRAFT_268150 [Colletotrichum navitas]
MPRCLDAFAIMSSVAGDAALEHVGHRNWRSAKPVPDAQSHPHGSLACPKASFLDHVGALAMFQRRIGPTWMRKKSPHSLAALALRNRQPSTIVSWLWASLCCCCHSARISCAMPRQPPAT